MSKPFRFSQKDIEYSKYVQARLINQPFELTANNLPPHILGWSDDFNVTTQHIDQYFKSLKDDVEHEALEWKKWKSFNSMQKESFQHHITVLNEQRQVLMQTQIQNQQKGGGGEGTSRGTIAVAAVSAEHTPISDKDPQSEGEKEIRDEDELLRSRKRGLSWKAISKGCVKGKRSVAALRSRYKRAYSLSGNTKTTRSHPVSRQKARATHSANETRNVRYWTKPELKIALQHMESISKNENWDDVLALLPNRTKSAIYARVNDWKRTGKIPTLDEVEDEDEKQDDEDEKMGKVAAPHEEESKHSATDYKDEKLENVAELKRNGTHDEDDDNSYSIYSIVD
ncbi:hypothetical protein IV203_000046 [Nitzschia inconspicua]|uniref:Uncharacterized protein n=1 Tax=Nitzschia inconspicua TaxID=303405 RepID=A0A9K3PPL7_9STRA|nr:hypothetical protein IV203_000046 [Nitzschia inconspicua]